MAADGTVLFTARHTDAVYAFDPDTGDIVWKLGGTTTPESLSIVGDLPGGPKRMHDVRVLPNGNVTVFDNRTSLPIPGGTATGPARYVEYDIDTAANTATMVREVRRANGNFSGAMGSARLQPDGGVLLNWGAVPGPIFTEANAAGTTVFELFMTGSNASYRTVKEPLGSFEIAELRATSGG
jgi:Arylsulfotransferase (ASST)